MNYGATCDSVLILILLFTNLTLKNFNCREFSNLWKVIITIYYGN